MKSLLILVALVAPLNCFASKQISTKERQYFASVGLGSTQSVAYTGTAGSTGQILSPVGSGTELVSILVTSAAFVAVGASASATTADMLVPANQPMILEMPVGSKVSAVQSASNGTVYVTHLITFPNND